MAESQVAECPTTESPDEWVAPKLPAFGNAKRQCEWYLKRFARYCMWCAKKAGVSDLPDYAAVETLMDWAGVDLIAVKISYSLKGHRQGLIARDIGALSNLASDYLNGTSLDFSVNIQLFCDFLESDKKVADRFFSYCDQIRRIIEIADY